MRKSGAQPIGNVIAEIVSRKGIGRKASANAMQQAWRKIAGQSLAAVTRCGDIRRRKLEVIVASSLIMQELTFQKAELLAKLRGTMPELQIDDLRFRVGPVANDG